MIKKDEFVNLVKLMQKFNNFMQELLNEGLNLYDSRVYDLPAQIFDGFLESHFTEHGSDLVFWMMYETAPKVIYEEDDNGRVEYEVDTPEKLYDYMLRDTKSYFK